MTGEDTCPTARGPESRRELRASQKQVTRNRVWGTRGMGNSFNVELRKSGAALLFLLALLAFRGTAPAADDILIADFEKAEPRDKKAVEEKWEFEGSSFLRAAKGQFSEANRDRNRHFTVSGAQGRMVLASVADRNIDSGTGHGLSPAFTIDRKYVKFRIAGGRYPGRTCLNLLVDGSVVRSATGDYSAVMKEVAFDVSPYLGRSARIEIVDREQQLWGHICVDNIVQSDEPARTVISTLDSTAVHQGTVHTPAAILAGKLDVVDGQIRVNDRPVPFKDIILVVSSKTVGEEKSAQMVKLISGDTLNAEFHTQGAGKLRVQGSIIGNHEIDIDAVLRLDFSPQAEGASLNRGGFLYLKDGDPIPGDVIKIDTGSVDFECPLGAITLPRERLLSYGVKRKERNTEPVVSDEVGLVDGSILMGTVELDGENLVVTNPVLASISVAWSNVRYLRRARPDVMWLSQATDIETDLKGAPFPPSPPHSIDAGARQDAGFLNATRIGARTMARYGMPVAVGKREFRAVMAPVLGLREKVMFSLEVSGKGVFKQQLDAKTKPQVLALDLPDGDELVVNVDFGERLSYPCGVDMGDAYVVTQQ